MSIYQKLNKARLTLQSKKLNKSGLNKFAGYKYFELGDFLPTVNEIFNEVGLCGVISFGEELATLTIAEIEGDGKVEITSPMKDANLKGCHPIQNLGAVETYTRRYLWVTAMEIVEHDALDSSEPAKTGHPSGKGDVPPPRESAKTIAQDVYDSFDDKQKIFIEDSAYSINEAMNDKDVAHAVDIFYNSKLTQEEQTAIWSKINSKHRSAIKKYRDEQRKEHKRTLAR